MILGDVFFFGTISELPPRGLFFDGLLEQSFVSTMSINV